MTNASDENPDVERIAILGLLDQEGRNSVVLHLFPSAASRLLRAAEWAKAHPEVEHVEIVLHGEKPDALSLTMPRAPLLGIAADLVQADSKGGGVLQ